MTYAPVQASCKELCKPLKRLAEFFVFVYKSLGQYRTEIVRQISSIIFHQIDKIDAGILTYFKKILAKDGVQNRQAVFVRGALARSKTTVLETAALDILSGLV